MLKKVARAITAHGLIPPGAGVVAGVSGGADSTALLRALNALKGELGFSLYAAHLNHGIRGEAADGDEAFTAELCKALGVELYAEKLDIPAIAKAAGKTLEQAARDERYAFFARAQERFGADRIAVAHNLEDQAESVLMHLVRGSGLAGLTGMAHRRGDIIRPLLGVRRAEIEAYLAAENAAYRTDETNFMRDAARNRVRLDVMPEIRKVNPNADEALCSTAELLSRDEEYLMAEAKAQLGRAARGGGYDRAGLAALPWPIKSRAIRIMLAEAGAATDIERRHVEMVDALLGAQTGARVDLPHVGAYVSYGLIFAGSTAQAEEFCAPFEANGKTCVPGGFFLAEEYFGDIIKNNVVAFFDKDKLPPEILARSRRPGDRFRPVGAPGSKKLKDFFIDRKVPRAGRGLPMLCAGGEVLFAPGYGISDTVKVDEKTQRVLRVIYESI